MQKRVNSVQRSNKSDILIGQSKKLTDSQSNASLDVATLDTQNARFDLIIFALDAHSLLLHNYNKLSSIFSCILLIRNHIISSCNME